MGVIGQFAFLIFFSLYMYIVFRFYLFATEAYVFLFQNWVRMKNAMEVMLIPRILYVLLSPGDYFEWLCEVIELIPFVSSSL